MGKPRLPSYSRLVPQAPDSLGKPHLDALDRLVAEIVDNSGAAADRPIDGYRGPGRELAGQGAAEGDVFGNAADDRNIAFGREGAADPHWDVLPAAQFGDVFAYGQSINDVPERISPSVMPGAEHPGHVGADPRQTFLDRMTADAAAEEADEAAGNRPAAIVPYADSEERLLAMAAMHNISRRQNARNVARSRNQPLPRPHALDALWNAATGGSSWGDLVDPQSSLTTWDYLSSVARDGSAEEKALLKRIINEGLTQRPVEELIPSDTLDPRARGGVARVFLADLAKPAEGAPSPLSEGRPDLLAPRTHESVVGVATPTETMPGPLSTSSKRLDSVQPDEEEWAQDGPAILAASSPASALPLSGNEISGRGDLTPPSPAVLLLSGLHGSARRMPPGFQNKWAPNTVLDHSVAGRPERAQQVLEALAPILFPRHVPSAFRLSSAETDAFDRVFRLAQAQAERLAETPGVLESTPIAPMGDGAADTVDMAIGTERQAKNALVADVFEAVVGRADQLSDPENQAAARLLQRFDNPRELAEMQLRYNAPRVKDSLMDMFAMAKGPSSDEMVDAVKAIIRRGPGGSVAPSATDMERFFGPMKERGVDVKDLEDLLAWRESIKNLAMEAAQDNKVVTGAGRMPGGAQPARTYVTETPQQRNTRLVIQASEGNQSALAQLMDDMSAFPRVSRRNTADGIAGAEAVAGRNSDLGGRPMIAETLAADPLTAATLLLRNAGSEHQYRADALAQEIERAYPAAQWNPAKAVFSLDENGVPRSRLSEEQTTLLASVADQAEKEQRAREAARKVGAANRMATEEPPPRYQYQPDVQPPASRGGPGSGGALPEWASVRPQEPPPPAAVHPDSPLVASLRQGATGQATPWEPRAPTLFRGDKGYAPVEEFRFAEDPLAVASRGTPPPRPEPSAEQQQALDQWREAHAAKIAATESAAARIKRMQEMDRILPTALWDEQLRANPDLADQRFILSARGSSASSPKVKVIQGPQEITRKTVRPKVGGGLEVVDERRTISAPAAAWIQSRFDYPPPLDVGGDLRGIHGLQGGAKAPDPDPAIGYEDSYSRAMSAEDALQGGLKGTVRAAFGAPLDVYYRAHPLGEAPVAASPFLEELARIYQGSDPLAEPPGLRLDETPPWVDAGPLLERLMPGRSGPDQGLGLRRPSAELRSRRSLLD